PRLLSRQDIAREEPIVELGNADGGVEYSDAYLHDNDARFVFNFVRSALNSGCVAANYVEALEGTREGDGYRLAARDVIDGRTFSVRARVVINAGGPYADGLNRRLGVETTHRHVLSKGIHLIVRRLTQSRRVLTFFADDGRLFFVIPMGPRTCVGTTDGRVEGPNVTVTEEDRRFVLDNINRRLRLEAPLTPADIIAERCGVRPLVVGSQGALSQNWLQLSRKHAIEAKSGVITVFGGKLTDCLNVGEEVSAEVNKLGVPIRFPDRKWYGEPAEEVKDEFFHQARLMDLDAMTAPLSSEALSVRLWRRYGAQAIGLLENIRQDPTAAEVLIEHAEYIRCEIEQAARREMITKLEDFLRRRSKISLVVSQAALSEAAGVHEACKILFGDEADAKYAEYFASGSRDDSIVRSAERRP
ncbi:MAG TPA: FAD-dependent oxidoreductase, partial [Polyangiaceae bacterium]